LSLAPLAQAGIRLGAAHPQPIVDHDTARKPALDALARRKTGGTDHRLSWSVMPHQTTRA
jgi:hypothetical protein